MSMPEIERIMVLSTAHIKPETNDWLQKPNDYVIQTDYGFMIETFLGWPREPEIVGEYPSDLMDVIREARAFNCVMVKLDCDALVYAGLPAYPWQ